MRVLIAAGGTGGHIYPGIAVANEIMRRDSSSVIKFVGTERGLETKIVPENGFELSLINSAGLKSVGIAGKIKGLAILPKSFLEARKLLKAFAPDVVIGAGGYVTGPVLLTASLMRIPTLAMDSNALPGFTNRQLARFITKAALTFEEALPYFGKKGVVTGNPVRAEFFEIPQKQRAAKFSLLIFGGSQGARAINFAMVDALDNLSDVKDALQITHQTGRHDFEKIRVSYQNKGWGDADIREYISNMMEEFAKTDLIVSRAGATTCAELAATGKAAVMIPLPTAADDHQRKNAEVFVNKGAAKMILQSKLNGETLAKTIKQLINSPKEITAMEEAARSLAKKDAVEATVTLLEGIAKNR
ncbi:MAG: undecaprenyldiphospho-muramoylpentapeptide beta-N-acetylglucosaminyltransferase [Pyrinomonadaceae bacterium]